MYALTKNYKSKAQAVNAIRLTANNKGWKVLQTAEAEQHVWPASDGYVVNNTTLNIALGFLAESAVEAADAVQAALNEQAVLDARSPKLQAASKLEMQKRENLAKPAKNKPAIDVAAKQTRCNVVNGARRPLRGKTLLVWETTEALHANSNEVPTFKQLYAALLATDAGFNKTTAGIQYYACKAYNGWE